jgi:sorting nexin-5/6/32
MTTEEFKKMKQELESEYLAMFKKTVQMHEVFLARLASHPAFRRDANFKVFLEYTQDLSVRSKNTKERFGGFVKSLSKNADEIRLSAQKDSDEFFEAQKKFLVDYHSKIRDSCAKADHMTYTHRSKCISVATNNKRLLAIQANKRAAMIKFSFYLKAWPTVTFAFRPV